MIGQRIITLTTDFGYDSHYVAQMKGAILSVAPEVRLVDLTHSIPPQDVRTAGWLLNETIAAFPKGTIHVAVIDPGVGSERTIVVARNRRGDCFVLPNNGLLTPVMHRSDEFALTDVVSVTNRQYWRADVSSTFHGRDIMGPVAAHLSLGVALDSFGPSLNELEQLQHDSPVITDKIVGAVCYVDTFGNLVTNISNRDLEKFAGTGRSPDSPENWQAIVGDHRVNRLSRCYADVADGELLALIGSTGLLEFAIAGGSAAAQLSLSAGVPVTISRGDIA